MSKYINEALCLLRQLKYPELYAITPSENFNKFKNDVYDTLSDFFRFRMSDRSLFAIPKNISGAKSFDEMFTALDGYYAENFSNHSDLMVVACGVYFDRMVRLLLSKVAMKYGQEFLNFSFCESSPNERLSFNFKLPLHQLDDLLSSLRADLLQNHTKNNVWQIMVRRGLDVKSMMVCDNELIVEMKSVSSVEVLDKMKSILYHWIIFHHCFPDFTLSDISISKNSKSNSEVNCIKISFRRNHADIVDNWRKGNWSFYQELVARCIPLHTVTLDVTNTFILKLSDNSLIHDEKVLFNIKIILLSSLFKLYGTTMCLEDIDIETSFKDE